MAKQPDSKAPEEQGSAATAAPARSDFHAIGGSLREDLNRSLLRQALGGLWCDPRLSEKERDARIRACMAAMMEFEPKDGIEGMMAAQAVALHSAAMECLRRAMIPDQPEQAQDQLRRQGANMSRAFMEMLAALDRKRGKGVKQVVRIERVVVNEGGQAIVGNVQGGVARTEPEGVGHDDETRGEPCAAPARLAHDAAPGTVLSPLRSANPGRDELPVASDAKRAVPDTRRGKHRA